MSKSEEREECMRKQIDAIKDDIVLELNGQSKVVLRYRLGDAEGELRELQRQSREELTLNCRVIKVLGKTVLRVRSMNGLFDSASLATLQKCAQAGVIYFKWQTPEGKWFHIEGGVLAPTSIHEDWFEVECFSIAHGEGQKAPRRETVRFCPQCGAANLQTEARCIKCNYCLVCDH